jgi:DNA-binding response OmpR family regulator
MPGTKKKMPASPALPESISILLVSPHHEDLAALRSILHHAYWDISHVSTAQQADRHVQTQATPVVLCECDLPDGSWRNVLRSVNASAARPLLLVVSRHADEALWAEVLNLGGYDVLLKPFETPEVVRVVGMAWRHWYNRPLALAAKTA